MNEVYNKWLLIKQIIGGIIMKLFGAMKVKNNELLVGGVSCSHLVREFGSHYM